MITISTTTDEESKSFLETEWQHADMEHYGPEVKWQEENFMFKATDEHHKIRGIIKGKYSMGVVDVNDVIVDHTQRRSGIGKQLIEYVEQFAREKKAHKIWFHTGKGWVLVIQSDQAHTGLSLLYFQPRGLHDLVSLGLGHWYLLPPRLNQRLLLISFQTS
jgi:GNAT superfamily N-acetyltransferase